MGKQIAFVQRLADAAQGIPIVRLLWHDLEAHLPEVMVQRRRPANLQLAHKGKTAAVGEGEVLVAIAEEERTCPFRSRFVDGLDSQSRRAIDLQPPGFCGIETKPKPDCGQCFVDHVIGRRQQAAGHQPLIPGFPHRRTGGIGLSAAATHPAVSTNIDFTGKAPHRAAWRRFPIRKRPLVAAGTMGPIPAGQ